MSRRPAPHGGGETPRAGLLARLSDAAYGWLLLAPALALLAVVVAWPLLRNLVLSFFEVGLGRQLSYGFVGLDHYRALVVDPRFHRALGHTALFAVVSTALELALGLVFALLLSRPFRGRGAARAAVLVPWVLPTAVMAMAWRFLFNDQVGAVNALLLRLGMIDAPINWLGEPGWAMAAAIAADVWKTTPFVVVILLAGLAAVPAELGEALAVDGAGPLRRFQLLTLPWLRPYLLLALLFRFIQAVGLFDLMWVLTGGGPGGSTEVLPLLIYESTFRYLDLGYGAALTVVTAALTLAAAFGVAWLQTREAAA
jgi:multiple sugar transport system permease protein